MTPLSLFGGRGFVGSAFQQDYPSHGVSMPRDQLVSDTNRVLYLVSTVSNANIHTNPYVDIDTNLSHLMRVLEACRKAHSDLEFNFVSSWFVYGPDLKTPAREDSACNPWGLYSITKRAAEQMLICYAETFGIRYRILRLCNVIGHEDVKASPDKNVIQWMLNRLMRNEPVHLVNPDAVTRDVLHVSDVASAINHTILCGEWNQIYNIGRGSSASLSYLIKRAKTLYSSSSSEITTQVKPAAPHATMDFQMNTDRLASLGWRPLLDFSQTLQRSMNLPCATS